MAKKKPPAKGATSVLSTVFISPDIYKIRLILIITDLHYITYTIHDPPSKTTYFRPQGE